MMKTKLAYMALVVIIALLGYYIGTLNDLKDEGPIIAIATVVLVVVTILYLLETRQMRITTQEMLRVSNTPEIQVSLYRIRNWSEHTLNLSIQNIGTGFAYDVEFDGDILSLQLRYNRTLADNEIMKNGISYLGPGKRYQIELGFEYKGSELDIPEETRSIDVKYMDSANAPHDKTFPLDFTKAEGYHQIGDPALDSIAESLRRIANRRSG